MKLKPYMTENEIKLFEKYLKNSKKYLEFGSGGSTYFAIQNGVDKITSIETDLKWMNRLKKNKKISSKIKNDELNLIYHDINCNWCEHISWNKNQRKMEETMKLSWKKYSDLTENLNYIPDLVLNDGRFRVVSLLKIYNKIDENTIILFHDYKDRSQYHIIENFFTEIENCEKLFVFKKRDNIDYELLKSIIEKYEFNID